MPPKVRNREKASPRLVNTKPHKFAALLSRPRPTLSVVVAAASAAAKTASLVNSGHDRRMGEEVLTAQGRRGNAVSGMGCVRGEAALARRPRRREPPSLPSIPVSLPLHRSRSLSLSRSTHHGRIPGIAADAALAAVGPPLATETPAV